MISEAVRGEGGQKARQKISFMTKIEVEARTLEEVRQAIEAQANVIMLDNMDNEMMKEAVQLIDHRALTHSVQAFDISMKF